VTPHYADRHLTVYQGHVLDVLAELPDDQMPTWFSS